MIGYWLGDGSSRSSKISSQDSTVLHYFAHKLREYNLSLVYTSQYDYGICGNHKVNNNVFLNTLKNLNLLNNKHIPLVYKCNSRENRLKLLAGIIDSDGHLNNNGGFEITQKSEQMIDDIIYLSRSLGFACYKNIKQISEWQKLNPEFSDPDSKQNDKYQKIILNSMSGSTKEESDKNYEKIVKNICKEVVIDKT
jgi:intein/homing endonuclease